MLVADEYRGGRLEWHHFRAETRSDLGAPRRARPAEQLVRTVMPTPVELRRHACRSALGDRGRTVRFGGLITGRTDLARLLLSEFALTYGNDWFVVPIDLPVGSICDITPLTVTDTFGERRTSCPAASRRTSWKMFTPERSGAPQRVQNLLFLPPVLLETQESDPLEEVAFFRDEMANIVWGVERAVQSEAGTRSTATRSTNAASVPAIDHECRPTSVTLSSSTASEHVPDHWHPFVPVRAAGAAPISGLIQLERRALVRVQPGGASEAIQPRGRVLTAAEPLRLEEEEVPRSGAVVTRNLQLSRWTDGRYILWSGRRKRVGTGEGASGLRFDVVAPVADA